MKAVLAVLLVAVPAHAEDAGYTIAAKGVAPERPGCASCHLQNGAGQPEVGIPRLAGLTATYLLDQLGYFASGARQNVAMAPYAQMLSPLQRRQVADYYASLPVPRFEGPPVTPPAALHAIGESVFLNGDAASGLYACAQCHGPSALGVGDFSPALAGQSAAYIEAKLQQWKSGALRDPGGAYMRSEASHLSAAQITAVSAYVASLEDRPR